MKRLTQEEFSMKLIKDLGVDTTKPVGSNDRRRKAIFECPICKEEFTTVVSIAKNSKSCNNCKQYGVKKYTTKDPLLSTWHRQKQRCYNKAHHKYPRYGGRGITMHKEWLDRPDLWLDYVTSLKSYNPADNTLSLDRIDNSKGYEPGNLRWANKSTQSQNTEHNRVSSTGYRNVTINKQGKYAVGVYVKNKKVHIGVFDTLKEAVHKRNAYIVTNNLAHPILEYKEI